MKQHITLEQLNELSEYQKERLNSIWIPNKYDLAVASICKDAMNDEYAQIEFVIGDIEVYELTSSKLLITLWNIKSLRDNIAEDEIEASEDEMSEQEWYKEDDDENNSDDEYSYECFNPVSYGKQDCLPLLNVGQMLKILQQFNYGDGRFYVDIVKNKKCGIGRDIYIYDNYGNDYEAMELCDVLWEAITLLL